jgi:hypothetical protein
MKISLCDKTVLMLQIIKPGFWAKKNKYYRHPNLGTLGLIVKVFIRSEKIRYIRSKGAEKNII